MVGEAAATSAGSVPALGQGFDAAGLVGLRAAVAAHGARLGAPADRVDHLVLIAHELATNAVRHGGGRGRLALWRDGDLVLCQVTDEGDPVLPGGEDLDEVGRWMPDPLAVDGRGVWLVRCLTDSLTFVSTSAGTTATAAIRL
jgi:anti-sigma regulatory factor (Ser/Thr protein kinase)